MSRTANSDAFDHHNVRKAPKDKYDKSHRSRNHIDILLEHTEAGLVDKQNAHLTDDKFSSVQTRATPEVQRKMFDVQEMNSEFDRTFSRQSLPWRNNCKLTCVKAEMHSELLIQRLWYNGKVFPPSSTETYRII